MTECMYEPYSFAPTSSFFIQILEYRQYHADKKQREDFIRNTNMVSFLITSKYSTQNRPTVLTSLRVERKKPKKAFEDFKAKECNFLEKRQPGSWFQSSF